MNKLILLTSLFTFTIMNLSAQSKTDKIKELLKLTNSEKSMKSTMDNMTRMFEQNPSAAKATKKDSLFKKYVKEEMTAFAKKIQEKDMVELYDQYFTLSDIQKFISFYNTAEGQKFLDLMPVIQSTLMTNMLKDDLPAMQAKFKKKLEELEN
ncbi:DUF2059 domain-containing protein [Daejeonella oryzae]|uniref:DUF2059 domain-containing protein n=1 Tax=Daejeonella oryzae TaxID=1122943 RepID=UPI00041615A9|nr:DUF2059 domain-containing protein [Daejeonella oryzae]